MGEAPSSAPLGGRNAMQKDKSLTIEANRPANAPPRLQQSTLPPPVPPPRKFVPPPPGLDSPPLPAAQSPARQKIFKTPPPAEAANTMMVTRKTMARDRNE